MVWRGRSQKAGAELGTVPQLDRQLCGRTAHIHHQVLLPNRDVLLFITVSPPVSMVSMVPLLHLEAKCPQLRRTGIDAGSGSSAASHQNEAQSDYWSFQKELPASGLESRSFPPATEEEEEEMRAGTDRIRPKLKCLICWSLEPCSPSELLRLFSCFSPCSFSLSHLDLFLQGSSNYFSLVFFIPNL